MGSLLTYLSAGNGRIGKASLEVLSRMRILAEKRSLPCEALVAAVEPEQYAEEAGRYGAERLHCVTWDGATALRNAALTSILAEAIQLLGPTLLAIPSNETTKDILGALAARSGCPVIPDVSSLSLGADGVQAERPVLAAKYISSVRARGDTVLVSVRSGAYAAEEQPVECETVSFDPDEIEEPFGKLLRQEVAKGGGVDLTEADVVVAAGRGVRDEAGRDLVLELADVLNAGIGASRAVVESGLFEASAQIGQTGKVVSPDLYIALGISGAIQHMAGAMNSRTIVAVNKDPDAPIFEYSDYGIVGDLYAVVPALTDAVRRLKSET